MAWFRQVRSADWATPADVKRAVRSVSILRDGRAVFNIAGNKYRIVVWINYPYRVVYIRFIGTHRPVWCCQERAAGAQYTAHRRLSVGANRGFALRAH
jgi:mRNA interferase HigB